MKTLTELLDELVATLKRITKEIKLQDYRTFTNAQEEQLATLCYLSDDRKFGAWKLIDKGNIDTDPDIKNLYPMQSPTWCCIDKDLMSQGKSVESSSKDEIKELANNWTTYYLVKIG